ncbi:pyridoxal-dependent decarboxylase, exosortase A system-associated [Noviherbaspirillum cavernae]|uniref:Pyridoxal-dependent decarboxylase, exosortase A system-associated n=1 Tax=Noviherbaspirillum cavernae TaxID=2320862 RepID=A0A418X3L9_9BURK|nr:pyridoxal-dependent decarboxylase, exosortase A system-associated [Noviherbaspirillum cavernae]RJG07054.1 pyridoxal-dependent decarboxylase, exosortase A system-associated [Noviherbaspirillum cavernae]
MNDAKARHAPQEQFPVAGNCLQIGGMSLNRLAQRVGKTPFYAYDRDLLTARVQHVRACVPDEIHVHYSVKANPMPAVVQHLAGMVDGLDVASAGELKIALDTPIDPDHVSFAGPAKTESELSQAVAAGIVLSLESERQLECVARIGEALGITPKVMLRINPDFELKSSGMKMGGGAKQFGVDVERAPALLESIGRLGMDFRGLHIFSGSQCLNADAIMEAQSRTFELALRLADFAPQDIRMLNIGGGFGIPYFPGERPLDLRPIGAHLEHWMPHLKSDLPQARVIIELGRYLVGEAGIYVTRVIERKESRGQVFLITDGGMHHHLAASGNLGQVIRKNYPVAVGNKMAETKREVVTVTGPLCTPLDLIADKMELARAEPGDLIVVFQSGAYGLTASPTGFLSHPRPGEVLV